MRTLVLAAAILTVAVPALAQVVQNNTGQALDANYQIGSGGFNTVTGGQGGVNSQLYVNRQVTGLSYFHGSTPIEATNQLRMNVPSSSMGDFVRRSSGIPQVLTGTGYISTPYYNPSNTVFGVRGINAGLAVPGGNAAIGQISPVAVQRIYTEVTAAYQPLLPPPGQNPTITSGQGAPMLSPITIVTRPGASAMFGVPQFVQGAELAAEVRQAMQGDQGPTPEEMGIGTDRTLGGTDVRELMNSTRGGKEGSIPLSNQDAYLDLLLTLQKQLEEQKKTPEAPLVRPGDTPDRPSPGSEKDGSEKDRGDEGALPGTPSSVKPLVERGKNGEIVIHGLAGLSPDLFNNYMNRAKRLAGEGKYYQASRQYEMAIVVDNANPMAPLGAGVTLFTAGEPYGAAMHIRKAMTLLPPLMETRVDLAAIVKKQDLATQVSLLDTRIAEKTGRVDPLLMFASAFMHQNLGETGKAKAAARMLEESGTKDKLYKAYAHFVLTGERPGAKK